MVPGDIHGAKERTSKRVMDATCLPPGSVSAVSDEARRWDQVETLLHRNSGPSSARVAGLLSGLSPEPRFFRHACQFLEVAARTQGVFVSSFSGLQIRPDSVPDLLAGLTDLRSWNVKKVLTKQKDEFMEEQKRPVQRAEKNQPGSWLRISFNQFKQKGKIGPLIKDHAWRSFLSRRSLPTRVPRNGQGHHLCPAFIPRSQA